MKAAVRLSISVCADPERACRVIQNWSDWPRTFPLTIQSVNLLSASENCLRLQVMHKAEGAVVNVLNSYRDGTIRLKEYKRNYDAEFLFFAEPAAGGSKLHVHACIFLKGGLGWFGCLAAPIIRSRIRKYLLEPLRARAEVDPRADAHRNAA